MNSLPTTKGGRDVIVNAAETKLTEEFFVLTITSLLLSNPSPLLTLLVVSPQQLLVGKHCTTSTS
jgi:hypothetical protein